MPYRYCSNCGGTGRVYYPHPKKTGAEVKQEAERRKAREEEKFRRLKMEQEKQERPAREFVESLNEKQKQSLAKILFIEPGGLVAELTNLSEVLKTCQR